LEWLTRVYHTNIHPSSTMFHTNIDTDSSCRRTGILDRMRIVSCACGVVSYLPAVMTAGTHWVRKAGDHQCKQHDVGFEFAPPTATRHIQETIRGRLRFLTSILFGPRLGLRTRFRKVQEMPMRRMGCVRPVWLVTRTRLALLRYSSQSWLS
jgi:hypothetical protein